MKLHIFEHVSRLYEEPDLHTDKESYYLSNIPNDSSLLSIKMDGLCEKDIKIVFHHWGILQLKDK